MNIVELFDIIKIGFSIAGVFLLLVWFSMINDKGGSQ